MSKKCTLCGGDEWVTDTYDDYLRLTSKEEEWLFLERIGSLSGIMAGRMVCPRCRPEWEQFSSLARTNQ